MHGKHHVAVAGEGKAINLWDLSTNTLVATLSGHEDQIDALESYTKNGVPMLVSGSCDGTIKLWDLSNKSNEYTFADLGDS